MSRQTQSLLTWVMWIAFLAAPVCARADVVYCELSALPALPMASDASEHLSADELLLRVATSYKGLFEFAGDEFSETFLRSLLVASTSLEKFFDPVPGRDQRSVAFNESLTKLGDWVMLESEDHGLKHEQIATRLRKVVRAHLRQIQAEQQRMDETREERADPGRSTTTGHVFYRDTRYPNLGEAWRDPSGMVWGEVVRNSDGSVRHMQRAEAVRHCKSIRAQLPSKEDFVRLSMYMGLDPKTNTGFIGQVLSHLRDELFWTSSVLAYYPRTMSYAFNSYTGNVGFYRNDDTYIGVRCVKLARRGSAP